MQKLYNEKHEAILKQMDKPVKSHILSKEHAKALYAFITSLTLTKESYISGKDTQINSSNNENNIAELLTANNFQHIQKQNKVASNTIKVSVFEEDYYGFNRSVTHPYSCNFVKPVDGLYYISQPCGPQSSPDFLTFHLDKGNVVSSFALEFKGSATTEKWNAHIHSMSRSIMYIIKRKNKIYCLFGDQIRNKISLLHALTHDELLRELVSISNTITTECNNVNIARPSHEFKGLDLDSNYQSNYNDIKNYFESFII
jgi:hypothetical protein